jgi:hypothetical protein
MNGMPNQIITALCMSMNDGEWEQFLNHHPHNDPDERYPWELHNTASRRARRSITPFKYRFARLAQGLGISAHQICRLSSIEPRALRAIDQRYSEWWKTVNNAQGKDMPEHEKVLMEALAMIAEKCGNVDYTFGGKL